MDGLLRSGNPADRSSTAYSSPMSPRSLQNRLLLGFFVSMTAILLCGGFVIYKVIGQHLEAENDALLLDRLNFFEAVTKLRSERGIVIPSFNIVEPEWARISATGNPDLVQGWVADTGTYMISANLARYNTAGIRARAIASIDCGYSTVMTRTTALMSNPAGWTGEAFNVQDANNMWEWLWQNDGTIAVRRTVAGSETTIATSAVLTRPLTSEPWTTEAIYTPDSIIIIANGVTAINYVSAGRTFGTLTKFGFCAYSANYAQFDTYQIYR